MNQELQFTQDSPVIEVVSNDGYLLKNFVVVGIPVKPNLPPFVCAAAKQGEFTSGSHIPIQVPTALDEQRPNYLVSLSWNIATEVKQQDARLEKFDTKLYSSQIKIRRLYPSPVGEGWGEEVQKTKFWSANGIAAAVPKLGVG